MTTNCDRCGRPLTAHEERHGWPAAALDVNGETQEYVCPDCDRDGYCRAGHLLDAERRGPCPVCHAPAYVAIINLSCWDREPFDLLLRAAGGGQTRCESLGADLAERLPTPQYAAVLLVGCEGES